MHAHAAPDLRSLPCARKAQNIQYGTGLIAQGIDPALSVGLCDQTVFREECKKAFGTKGGDQFFSRIPSASVIMAFAGACMKQIAPAVSGRQQLSSGTGFLLEDQGILPQNGSGGEAGSTAAQNNDTADLRVRWFRPGSAERLRNRCRRLRLKSFGRILPGPRCRRFGHLSLPLHGRGRLLHVSVCAALRRVP